MNDRDCESCKKFSRVDPIESEGYCDAKRTWVDPQEGEDCKMHEFTLHSATKYKDGTPIMSEPEKVCCETDTYATRKAEKNSMFGKTVEEMSNQLDPNYAHIFSNFCGNCTHFEVVEGIGICELSGEIIDPDDSSCAMFEPPF